LLLHQSAVCAHVVVVVVVVVVLLLVSRSFHRYHLLG
jgi:hypothetical protein